MQRSALLVGLGAGLAAAVLFASATGGSVTLGFLLFFLAPLPAFLAGLGWGWMSAAAAGLAGTLLVGIATRPLAGMVYAATQALPVVVLTYLAYLNRPVSSAGSAPQVEWYPVGRLVSWTAAMSGALAVGSLFAMGGDVEAIRARLKPIIELIVTKQLPSLGQRQLSPADMDGLTEVALYILPAASAVLYMSGLLFNLWVAARITQTSGNLARPWPDLPAIQVPAGTALALAAATAGTFLGGLPALVASGFAGAIYFAYVLIGLAIAHYITRGVAARPFILFAVYAGMILLNTWMSVLLALIGLAEPWAPWRRSRASPPAPPADT